jgi:hypothetical protein
MLNQELTNSQVKIIKYICTIQLQSLERLLSNNSHSEIDIILFLARNDINKDNFKRELLDSINDFDTLKNNPDCLQILSKKDLSIFRHLLFNLEDEFKYKYPKAIKNLWLRLNLIEDSEKEIFKLFSIN